MLPLWQKDWLGIQLFMQACIYMCVCVCILCTHLAQFLMLIICFPEYSKLSEYRNKTLQIFQLCSECLIYWYRNQNLSTYAEICKFDSWSSNCSLAHAVTWWPVLCRGVVQSNASFLLMFNMMDIRFIPVLKTFLQVWRKFLCIPPICWGSCLHFWLQSYR